MSKLKIYRVLFSNHGALYEVYAREVAQDSMLGFIEVGDFVFGGTSEVVVDPSEERLKQEFSNVRRTYIPIHTVIRIDEVEKEGISKIKEIGEKGSKVTPFPLSFYSPSENPDKK